MMFQLYFLSFGIEYFRGHSFINGYNSCSEFVNNDQAFLFPNVSIRRNLCYVFFYLNCAICFSNENYEGGK